jgi:cytoskeletal protein CcmA (bactofilin family)
MGWFGRDSSGNYQEQLETLVGPSASLNGHLKTDGGVRIDGAFEGVIEATGNVVVGEGARVVADITARNITVGGAIKGNIDGTGRLEILSTGEVYGDIMVGSVMIDEGGLFQGTSRMRGMEQRALTAPADDGSHGATDGDVIDLTPEEGVIDVAIGGAAKDEDARDVDKQSEIVESEPERVQSAPDVAVPDLDVDDIEPIIPDVVIEDMPETKSKRKSGKKRGRGK